MRRPLSMRLCLLAWAAMTAAPVLALVALLDAIGLPATVVAVLSWLATPAAMFGAVYLTAGLRDRVGR